MYPVPDLVGSSSVVYWIPAGHLGIEATVRHMRRLVGAAQLDDLLRETAASIVGPDPCSTAERVRDFLQENVLFRRDPLGTELLKTPRYMLREIAEHGEAIGDCDDVAVLGAALGRAAGLPARFVLLAFREGAPYEHVYTELATPEGWLELDTTRPFQLPPELRIVRVAHREA